MYQEDILDSKGSVVEQVIFFSSGARLLKEATDSPSLEISYRGSTGAWLEML